MIQTTRGNPRQLSRRCFSWRDDEDEMTARFNISIPSMNKTYISWTSSIENDDDWGKRSKTQEGFNYGASGYIVDLPRDAERAKQIVKELDANGFLDEQTQVLFLDFVTFHAGRLLHCVARLTYEFTDVGFVYPEMVIKAFKFKIKGPAVELSYVLLFAASVLYYTHEEINECCQKNLD